jgi:hypothetical protein
MRAQGWEAHEHGDQDLPECQPILDLRRAGLFGKPSLFSGLPSGEEPRAVGGCIDNAYEPLADPGEAHPGKTRTIRSCLPISQHKQCTSAVMGRAILATIIDEDLASHPPRSPNREAIVTQDVASAMRRRDEPRRDRQITVRPVG